MPVRSRHCIQQCIANYVTEKSGRRRYALRCEPGNLPAVVREFVEFQITRFDRTEIYIFYLISTIQLRYASWIFSFPYSLIGFLVKFLRKGEVKKMKKKLVALLCISAMVLALAACGNNSESDGSRC